ncbi:MAG: ThuA domain-containing protein [Phycisphaerales bacterium]|nr:MAG: ThuA domain-containing protein [Phycisphaerales bacterium]
MNTRLRAAIMVLSVTSCLSNQGGALAAGVSADALQKIQKAIPKEAAVKPLKPRKLLVFTRAKGLVHTSIPHATKAIELMAKETGAFEIVVSDEMSVFNPKTLKPFDAICFNNSNRMDFTEPAMRQSLMDFVRSGKGIVGIHAATTNFSSRPPVGGVDWPEAGEMMGGIFAGHHWRSGQGEWAVKIDEPDHPLNATFTGKGFKIADEIYMYENLQKDKVRVLLSLDFSDPKTASVKQDQTYVPISWVRDWGKGRVFYCSLGHDNHVFWNPAVLKHYLDGIQFALGDLSAETAPRPQQDPVRAGTEQTVISEDWGTLTWLAGKNIGNAEGLVLGRVTIRAGKSNPRHRHPNCEEVLYLLKGRLEHTMDDRTFTLAAGDTITIGPGVFHNATCIGNEDADMIVVYSEGIRGFEPE